MGAPLLSLVKPQFGIESGGFGANAAATRMLINIETFDPAPEQTKSATGTQGLKYLVRSNTVKETSKASIKGILDYIDVGYVLSGVEGLPVEGAFSPGGVPVTGVYQHVWQSSAYNADSAQTYTVEFPASIGDRVQKVNGLLFTGYKIGTERDKPLTFEASAIAKAIQDEDGSGDPIVASAGQNDVQTLTLTDATGGTFIVVVDNQQTTPIAYDATAATFQTAFRALGGSRATALVSGAAGGPFAVTDENGVAVQAYSVLFSGLNEGASAAWMHTTVGGMKMNPSFEVMPGDISIGWAGSMAGLDNAPTTPINQYKTNLQIADRWEFVWRQNPTDVGPGGISEKKAADQKHVQSMMLAYTAEVASFISGSRLVGNGLYFRILFTGPVIAGTGVPRSLAFDYYCSVEWKTANGEGLGNIRTCEFDLENLFDVNGVFCRRITAINELASYSAA